MPVHLVLLGMTITLGAEPADLGDPVVEVPPVNARLQGSAVLALCVGRNTTPLWSAPSAASGGSGSGSCTTVACGTLFSYRALEIVLGESGSRSDERSLSLCRFAVWHVALPEG